jgi:hypothetical protein
LNTIRHVIRAFGLAVHSAYGGADVSSATGDKKKKKKQTKTGAIDDPECKTSYLPEDHHINFLRFSI